MAIDFFVSTSWIESPWAWLSFIFSIIAYTFLIVGSFDLKKDERKFEAVKFLTTVGIILLTWRIIIQFLPSVMFSYTYPELLIAFSYILTLQCLSDTFFLMLGIAFLSFGGKNKEHHGVLMTAGGIMVIVAASLSLAMNDVVYLIDVLLDPPLFAVPTVFYEASAYLVIILVLIMAILFLVYTILIKKIFLIISAAFFVTISFFALLAITGVIGYFYIF